jgi:DUF4097 and DUF4098 domain-containing protein YvlB
MNPGRTYAMNPGISASGILRPARNLLLCALPILGLAGCAIGQVSAKGELSQAVADAKSVVVSTENGSVELIRDPAATTMQVSAAIRCSADTEEEAAARVKATKLTASRDDDGKVRIAVEFSPHEPAVTVLFVGAVAGSRDSASIVIRAASLDGVEVSTNNGSIAVGAFAGPAKLETTNGSIELRDHAGPIDARSSNGAIRASGVLAPVVADTSNGRIEIALAPQAQGDLELDTSNGSVLLELGEGWQGTVTADTSNGKIDLSGGEVVRTRGAKTMTIGDAAKATARIDTSNGRVTVRAAKK